MVKIEIKEIKTNWHKSWIFLFLLGIFLSGIFLFCIDVFMVACWLLLYFFVLYMEKYLISHTPKGFQEKHYPLFCVSAGFGVLGVFVLVAKLIECCGFFSFYFLDTLLDYFCNMGTYVGVVVLEMIPFPYLRIWSGK